MGNHPSTNIHRPIIIRPAEAISRSFDRFNDRLNMGAHLVIDGEEVSSDNPVVTESVVPENVLANIIDALERVQQQLGLITGVDLKRGERIE